MYSRCCLFTIYFLHLRNSAGRVCLLYMLVHCWHGAFNFILYNIQVLTFYCMLWLLMLRSTIDVPYYIYLFHFIYLLFVVILFYSCILSICLLLLMYLISFAYFLYSIYSLLPYHSIYIFYLSAFYYWYTIFYLPIYLILSIYLLLSYHSTYILYLSLDTRSHILIFVFLLCFCRFVVFACLIMFARELTLRFCMASTPLHAFKHMTFPFPQPPIPHCCFCAHICSHTFSCFFPPV